MEIQIKKVGQEEKLFCSIATIQMAYRFVKHDNNLMQQKIGENLKSLKQQKCDPRVQNSTQMPDNNTTYPYYHDILSSNGISSQTFNFLEFPSPDFVTNYLKNGKPVIFSFIFHPLTYGARHVFLSTGYFNETSGVFWLLANDPMPLNEGTKVAWVYQELIDFHLEILRFSTDENIDIVTNFESSPRPILKITDKARINNPRLVTHPTYVYNANTFNNSFKSFLIDILKKEVLKTFFGFSYNSRTQVIWDPRQYFSLDYTQVQDLQTLKRELDGFSVATFSYLPSVLEGTFRKNRLLFYPIFENEVPKIEIILREKTDNRLVLMGVQEPSNIFGIGEVTTTIENGRIKFTINHKLNNYKILNINLINLRFLAFKDINEIWYFTPTTNTSLFTVGIAYSHSEFITNLKQTIY